MFADFCAEIGVDNIREYEQEHLKQRMELDKKQYDQHVPENSTNTQVISNRRRTADLLCLCRLEFETHRTRLNAQLEYEQKQLEQRKNKLRKMEETIKTVEAMVAEQKQVFICYRNNDLCIYKSILC